jgi:aryl-alcohol dehydrogenase-like predicted oxidoreductase
MNVICPQLPLGKTGVFLSRLAFGSMRLEEKSLSDKQWRDLLRHSYNQGITTLHSSDEYESFSRFARLVRELQSDGLKFQHIVKLGEPHFGHKNFSSDRFESRINEYCQKLGVDYLDVVQWLWRGNLQDDPERLQGLLDNASSIDQAICLAKSSGIINAALCFPYTNTFAQMVLNYSWCDGLTIYLNPLEDEMSEFLPLLDYSNKAAISIRPLAAGKALKQGYFLQDCLAAALPSPTVTSTIVSWSSVEQIQLLLSHLP